MEVRNYSGKGCTTIGFKNLLQNYLKAIPDRPRDPIGKHWPEAVNIEGKPSNSLIDWQNKLKEQIREREDYYDLKEEVMGLKAFDLKRDLDRRHWKYTEACLKKH